MTKVLHVSHSLDTGGGPLYIKKIIEDVPQIDHHVAGNSGFYFQLFQKKLSTEKVLQLQGKSLLQNILLLKKICKEKAIRIIHCHGRGAGLYSRLLKVFAPHLKIIYTVHGFHPDTLNFLIKPFYILLEKILLSFTDVVINVSRSELQRFNEKIKPRDGSKIYYIPNYITESDIIHRPLTVALDKQNINFLYVGRLSHEKGIDILLDAWSKLENKRCKLFVIGYGPLEPLVSSFLKNKSITYLGKVENASSYISHFHAVVIPSRFEGMPYIGLETMISQTCAIVTPAVGIIDLFTPETSYMASDFSPTALFQSIDAFIQDFIANPAYITDKIQRNYERVQSEFSPANAFKLREIYESLT